jgi:hypothetical protein
MKSQTSPLTYIHFQESFLPSFFLKKLAAGGTRLPDKSQFIFCQISTILFFKTKNSIIFFKTKIFIEKGKMLCYNW